MSARHSALGMLLGMLALSGAAHALAFVVLQWVPPIAPAHAPLEIESIELRETPPITAPSAPEADSPKGPASTAPPPRKPARPAKRKAEAPQPAPAPTASLPAPAPHDASTDWIVPATPSAVPPEPAELAPAPAAPSLVPLASLSRKPDAPGRLDALLQRYYPTRARAEGMAGEVVVRMRIAADGGVSAVRVVREQPRGFDFARACQTMLSRAPRFLPGLDRAGHAVDTEVSFTCAFEVEY